MNKLDKLLDKYEDVKERMLVMDDYDGGQMHMVDLIVRDLKELKSNLDESTFSKKWYEKPCYKSMMDGVDEMEHGAGLRPDLRTKLSKKDEKTS